MWIQILTSNYCPECDQLVYIRIYAVDDNLRIGQCVYLDKDGVLCITPNFNDDKVPTYHCIFCRWSV